MDVFIELRLTFCATFWGLTETSLRFYTTLEFCFISNLARARVPKRCCGADGCLLPGSAPSDAGQMLPGDGRLQERGAELQLSHGEQATVEGPLLG